MKAQMLIPIAMIGLVAMFVTSSRLTAQEKKSELLTVAATVSTPSNTEPKHSLAIVQGRVMDAQTGAAIAGATVKWKRHHRSVQGTTDVRGAFAFAISVVEDEDRNDDDIDRTKKRDRDDDDQDRDDRDDDDNGGEIKVSVRANLYRPAAHHIHIRAGEVSKLDLHLERKPADEIGAVTGHITDASTGLGVGGVSVAIENAGGNLSTTTQANGSYIIPNVGFAANLNLSVVTNSPPCLTAAQRSFNLARSVMTENFSLNPAITHKLGCQNEPVPFAGPLGTPPPPDDHNLQWQQADVVTIQDQALGSDAWFAGHVNDVLPLSDPSGGNDVLLAASHTGGVWIILPTEQNAFPLSDTWTSVDMNSVALGPDGPRHLYAGTWNSQESPGGVLYETDTSDPLAIFSWRPVNSAPPFNSALPCATNGGSIERILVDNNKRRIILACDNGIWWSPIPPKPSVHGVYNWTQAVAGPAVPQANLNRKFSGLAFGLQSENGDQEIVASAWKGQSPGNLIFYGSWMNGNLVFNAAFVPNLPGDLFSSFGRTSVSSCPANPGLMYAVSSDGNDVNLGGVFSSNDGGHHWTALAQPDAGQQGSWNNAIAVSPDCSTVALGWQNGTFLSFDAGGSWNPLQDPSGHLHADVHALAFDPSDSTTLYIGSDGGVASASGIGQGQTPVFASHNRRLLNLQMYHADASSQFSGLAAAGLQDNGALFAQLPGPWQHLSDCGCDGLLAQFVNPPALAAGDDVLLVGEFGQPYFPWASVQSDANKNPVFTFKSAQRIPLDGDTTGNGLADGPPGVQSAVKIPHFRNDAGQLLYALTGLGANVYGAFANDDGTGIHWVTLGTVGANQNVTALASSLGDAVYVGTDQGNIYRLDPPYGNGNTGTQLTITPPDANGKAQINSLVEPFPGVVFAAMQTGSGSNGYVLSWSGQSWNALTGGLPNNLPFQTVESQGLAALYTATRTTVYLSHDLGKSWFRASDGLPAVSQGMELHFVSQPDGTNYLYLATYGRSLWRAVVP